MASAKITNHGGIYIEFDNNTQHYQMIWKAKKFANNIINDNFILLTADFRKNMIISKMSIVIFHIMEKIILKMYQCNK